MLNNKRHLWLKDVAASRKNPMNGALIVGVSVAENGSLFCPESPRGRGRSARLILLTAFKRGVTASCWNECECRPGESSRPQRYAAPMFPILFS
ncbi:hypothetical protein NDU88_003226 [Pleurodeles waltl]|uniref:CMP/dCMP-type deaminase domain-containing protein n=1 Tax=Pleurodeles waltl TaxID=8319 RepID=A0AAV7T4G1_PLEWA|nr:hypothetical protein NDU88_003226 [Pleurodeles waltl]